jgi:hypothetical protein
MADIPVIVFQSTVYAVPQQGGNTSQHGIVRAAGAALPVLTVPQVPPPGTVLQPLDSVTLSFTTQGGDTIDRVILWARFPGAGSTAELIYDTDGFVPPYLGSTRVGDTFVIRRLAGWPSAPTFFVHADSAAGGKN